MAQVDHLNGAQITWTAEPLSVGRSSFTFSAWDGPDLRVWAYVPEGIDPKNAPIMIIMHGATRDPRRYLEDWTAIADASGFIAVAPEFSQADFRTSRQYNMGNVVTRRTGRLRDEEDWSFAAIEPLFDTVVTRLGGAQQHYTLYGHSAGSQFVHRFMYFMPQARARRYIAANAGWYTLPTYELDFPYGLGLTGIDESELQAALASDLVILLGDADIDPEHASLNRSDNAMMQGPHRFARGQLFYFAGQRVARDNGWEFNWSMRFVPGVAHSNAGIAAASGDLIE